MVASDGAGFLTSLIAREAEERGAPCLHYHVTDDDHPVVPIGAWHSGVAEQPEPDLFDSDKLEKFLDSIL